MESDLSKILEAFCEGGVCNGVPLSVAMEAAMKKACMDDWLSDLLEVKHTCAPPPRTDEPPSYDLSKYNITAAADEEITMFAQNVILQDNGEESLPDEVEKVMRERYMTVDGDDTVWNLICNTDIFDYYMNKVGRWEEYVKWQKEHKMNGF